MSDDVSRHEIEWLQEQLYQQKYIIEDQQQRLEKLEQMYNLLEADFNTVKIEGCWRFFESPKHSHKEKDE